MKIEISRILFVSFDLNSCVTSILKFRFVINRNFQKKLVSLQSTIMSKMDELIDRFPFLSRTIFRHLDAVNLNWCRLVCMKWKAAIECDQYFWDSCFEILKDGLVELESEYGTFRQTNNSFICTAQGWCDLYEHFSETNETFDEMIEYVVFLQNYFYYGRYHSDSPLNFAARIGNMFIIELCMERNFNFKKPDRNAPLHCACIHGQLDVVKYIFEHSESHGIDLDTIGEYETPLRHTAYTEHVDVFNYFLDSAKAKGIPICFRSKGGYSVVDNMSDACFKVLMERAIEVGFDINGSPHLLAKMDLAKAWIRTRLL